MILSKGPVRHSLTRRGIVIRIFRSRQYSRILRLLYPLSPITLCGRILGCPGPLRLTAPPSISVSNIVASCCCPGVSATVISLPLPSARRCTLVLNPPWLRPNASLVGSPLLRPLHADEPEQLCHQRSGLPSQSSVVRLPFVESRQASCPRFLPFAIDRTWSLPSAKDHTARASLSTVLQFAESIVLRSVPACGRQRVVRSSVSEAGGSAESSPNARLSNLLCSYRKLYQITSL
jgi:hypothetical protein